MHQRTMSESCARAMHLVNGKDETTCARAEERRERVHSQNAFANRIAGTIADADARVVHYCHECRNC